MRALLLRFGNVVIPRNYHTIPGEAMLIKTLLNKVERFKSFVQG